MILLNEKPLVLFITGTTGNELFTKQHQNVYPKNTDKNKVKFNQLAEYNVFKKPDKTQT
jgi:hypothetical protein